MNQSNQGITFRGGKLTIKSDAVKVGDTAPQFKLTANDMSDLSLDAFDGKVLVIAAVPSLDTPVCAEEAKKFNQQAAELSADVKILFVSLDLPFAQKRYCAAEGVERISTASDYKYRTFGKAYGTYIEEMGLLARSIFVIGKDKKVKHVEYVPDISQEPDYNAVLSKVRELA